MKLYKIKHTPTGLFVGKSLNMYVGYLNSRGKVWKRNPMTYFHKQKYSLNRYTYVEHIKHYPIEEFELIEYSLFDAATVEKNTQSLINLGKEVSSYASKFRGSGMYDEILLAIEFGYELANKEQQ